MLSVLAPGLAELDEIAWPMITASWTNQTESLERRPRCVRGEGLSPLSVRIQFYG